MTTGTDQCKTYLFSYNHEGNRWGLEIQARDADDAKTRLGRLAFATYNGELKASIPVSPSSLRKAVALRARRLWVWMVG